MYVSKVLKILYAPRKTLKEVIENPKYIGPLLVMVLLVAATLGATYVALSKNYPEQTLPTGASNYDEWTQNSTFWTSNAMVNESSNCINQTSFYGTYYYGNASIEFSITNSSLVWMQLNGIGPVNCTGPDGYSVLSFRTKLTSPDAAPRNVTLQMFSANISDYYYRNLNDEFGNESTDVWNNITVTLASTEWNTTGNGADWQKITGLELNFTWNTSSNITALIDGLFFHGLFKSQLEMAGPTYLASSAVATGLQFAVTWILLAGLTYILVRALGGKLSWRPMLIAAGFILIVMFVQAMITVIGYLTWPAANIPFQLLGGVAGEGDVALKTITDQRWLGSQINFYAEILALVWIMALVAVATRLLAQFSWVKSVTVGILAYIITIIVVGLGSALGIIA